MRKGEREAGRERRRGGREEGRESSGVGISGVWWGRLADQSSTQAIFGRHG